MEGLLAEARELEACWVRFHEDGQASMQLFTDCVERCIAHQSTGLLREHGSELGGIPRAAVRAEGCFGGDVAPRVRAEAALCQIRSEYLPNLKAALHGLGMLVARARALLVVCGAEERIVASMQFSELVERHAMHAGEYELALGIASRLSVEPPTPVAELRSYGIVHGARPFVQAQQQRPDLPIDAVRTAAPL